MVRITAAALVSNLVLEFSPMKEVLIELGCMERVCALARSKELLLKVNALWALKNGAHLSLGSSSRADRDCRSELPQQECIQASDDGPARVALPRRVSVQITRSWGELMVLCRMISDPNEEVSEQALGILRNITCTSEDDEPVTGLLEMGEERMLALLEESLQSKSDRIALQVSLLESGCEGLSLTSLSRRCTSSSTLRRATNRQSLRSSLGMASFAVSFRISFVVSSLLPLLLLILFSSQSHPDTDLRTAAVWTIMSVSLRPPSAAVLRTH